MAMKTGAKRAFIIAGAVAALFGYRELVAYGVVSRPDALKTVIPLKVVNIDAEVLAARTDVKLLPMPSSSVSGLNVPVVIRFLIWEWNANIGAIFANGGPTTTKGSLMEQNGVKLEFTRQDNTDIMTAQQIAFANDYCASGAETKKGVHFVTIMGDQGAGYIGPVNDRLKAYGPDCALEVVGSWGYSRKEDKFMGPQEWKDNPQAARGQLVAGAPREGDWNLFVRWENENKVPNNPDEKTFDLDAVNWLSATYTEAPERYISGYCEERPIKNNPSKKTTLCVKGIVTWTPGDVTAAMKKGGLVSLMDTGMAIFQMPCVVIGLKKWDAANPELVAGMIAAAAEGADQIRANPVALRRAGEISTQIYKDQNADYWVKYYKGVTEKDKTGVDIDLGGSYASNLADMYQLFGLSGGPNLFKATYDTFGAVVVQQYPNLFKSFPPAVTIQNTRYLQMASAKMENVEKGSAEKITYTSAPIKDVVGKRDYSINFDTGLATIRPDSTPTLDMIYNDLITGKLKAQVVGFTDSTGNPDNNQRLSAARAQSVKYYLRGKGGIPDQRVEAEGRGQAEPVASNDTPQGRAANRRVTVILGQ